MARTSKADDPPSVVHPIRFRVADLDAVRRAAAVEHVTVAQFIRAAALRAAEHLGAVAVEEPTLEQRVEYLERVVGRHEATLAKLVRGSGS